MLQAPGSPRPPEQARSVARASRRLFSESTASPSPTWALRRLARGAREPALRRGPGQPYSERQEAEERVFLTSPSAPTAADPTAADPTAADPAREDGRRGLRSLRPRGSSSPSPTGSSSFSLSPGGHSRGYMLDVSLPTAVPGAPRVPHTLVDTRVCPFPEKLLFPSWAVGESGHTGTCPESPKSLLCLARPRRGRGQAGVTLAPGRGPGPGPDQHTRPLEEGIQLLECHFPALDISQQIY